MVFVCGPYGSSFVLVKPILKFGSYKVTQEIRKELNTMETIGRVEGLGFAVE